MNEYVTDAFVLKSNSWANKDKQIILFTKELGKVKARATSASKITSKLSPHLDVINLSTIRLVEKNSFIITDALTKERFKKIRDNEKILEKALETINLIEEITPYNLVDNDLWNLLLLSFRNKKFDNKKFLEILGYNPVLATCSICNNKKIKYFTTSNQNFICSNCIKKIKNEDKILIN
jgi:DNA repair protein RecO